MFTISVLRYVAFCCRYYGERVSSEYHAHREGLSSGLQILSGLSTVHRLITRVFVHLMCVFVLSSVCFLDFTMFVKSLKVFVTLCFVQLLSLTMSYYLIRW
jgi:hypothetical protein